MSGLYEDMEVTILRKKIGEKYNENGKPDANGTVYGVPEYTVSYSSSVIKPFL